VSESIGPYSEIVLLASQFIPECSVYWDEPVSGYYALQLCSGSLELSCNDNPYRLEGLNYFWLVPGAQSRFWPAEHHPFWSHRYITFSGPLAGRWAALGLLPLTPQTAPDSAIEQFDLLLALARRADNWGQRRAINTLEQILLELADLRTETSTPPAWLESILRDLSLASFAPDYPKIASAHSMSLSGLREQFKRAMGITLHAYTLQVRLARARSLITETDLALSAIAEQLGYSDIYYFSRQFHQQTGVTPSAFRRSRLK
jgi:AraC-like DNA-binding protein